MKPPHNTKSDLKVRDDICAKGKKKRKRCHLFWILWGWRIHKFKCPGSKPIPFCGYFEFWLCSGSCADSQPAVCWYFPPTHNSGLPGHSSADRAAHPEPRCSVRSVLLWNWILSCISKINQRNRKKNLLKSQVTTRVAQNYRFAKTFRIKCQQ